MNENFLIERQLLRIGNNLFTRRDKNLKQFGLTTSQSEALLFFYNNEGAIVLDFAKHMLISHQAARNIVERLKEKGFLEITIDEKDARARKIHLTAKGAALHDKLVKIGMEEGEKILQNLNNAEKYLLVEFLEKINRNL